jgi:hypothetical protein
MFSLSESNHYVVCVRGVDLRKGLNGLCGLIHCLSLSSSNGDVYVFFNKSRNSFSITVLSVINVDASPGSLYILIKELNVQFMGVLFPDKTYEHKSSKDKLIGNWLIKLFDIWYK